MLRACRRVLRPGGRLGFYTIFVPAGLSKDEYRRALVAGPTYVDSRRVDQPDLLRRAGFVDIDQLDLTEDFLRTARAWVEARLRHAHELPAANRAQCDQRVQEGRANIAAIEAGLLRRALFLARRPHPRDGLARRERFRAEQAQS